MSNTNMEGLPPEMQARIAQIIEQAKANRLLLTLRMKQPWLHNQSLKKSLLQYSVLHL